MSERLKAWKVYVSGFGPDPVAIVSAETRAKATGRSFADAQKAGYELCWSLFRTLRAPEFDRLAGLYGRFGWNPEHASQMLKNLKP